MERSSPLQGLAFGRFFLLPQRRELFADGQPVKLGGRTFDVLMALVNARGTVLSKDELMERAWPGRIVEETALQSQISALRSALGADRYLIRTISGRGYQFTGVIRSLQADLGERVDAATSPPGCAIARGADAYQRTRAAISSGRRVDVCAAAISMASGIPSSRRQTAATPLMARGSSDKSGLTARAR